jgi:hypothetical protein
VTEPGGGNDPATRGSRDDAVLVALRVLSAKGLAMRSGKQRRAELDVKKHARAAKAAAEAREKARAEEHADAVRLAAKGVAVNRAALAPHGSYSEPDFVTRGHYTDLPFTCRNCGKAEVWTATQQKWWYEVAKGNVFTTATRCRPCRRRERDRRTQARRTHLQGLSRKRAGDAG